MKSVLQARPEACVAVLCHWGVITALRRGADIPTIAPSECRVRRFVMRFVWRSD